MERSRNRVAYGALSVGVMLLGLASRRYGLLLPLFLRKSLGDALWAMLVFVLCGMLFPRRSTLWTAGMALAFSILIEFSQLYQASWINAIRAVPLGRLVLGSGFAWNDMAYYMAGIAAGAAAEYAKPRLSATPPLSS